MMLLTSSPEQIEKLVEGYEKEVEGIKGECLKLCWYMRGGITYDQAVALSYNERSAVGQIIKDNLETTKKSGLPFF